MDVLVVDTELVVLDVVDKVEEVVEIVVLVSDVGVVVGDVEGQKVLFI